jgi:hypothetical protein
MIVQSFVNVALNRIVAMKKIINKSYCSTVKLGLVGLGTKG